LWVKKKNVIVIVQFNWTKFLIGVAIPSLLFLFHSISFFPKYYFQNPKKPQPLFFLISLQIPPTLFTLIFHGFRIHFLFLQILLSIFWFAFENRSQYFEFPIQNRSVITIFNNFVRIVSSLCQFWYNFNFFNVNHYLHLWFFDGGQWSSWWSELRMVPSQKGFSFRSFLLYFHIIIFFQLSSYNLFVNSLLLLLCLLKSDKEKMKIFYTVFKTSL
jgi:hypothetical protein